MWQSQILGQLRSGVYLPVHVAVFLSIGKHAASDLLLPHTFDKAVAMLQMEVYHPDGMPATLGISQLVYFLKL